MKLYDAQGRLIPGPGPAGPAGPAGADGAVGPAIFMAADDGEDGFSIPGRDGVNGVNGANGANGSNGATGAAGPVGPALFLMAEDGQDGDMGPPGAQGPQGATGATGATGPAGPPGSGSSVLSDLLLHFNGSNGATSTTDSGQHTFTVTRVGSATLENTQVKFGTTATQVTSANGWSVADDPALRFGVNDFTIDLWIYPTAWNSGTNKESGIITKWGGSTNEWYFSNNSSNGPSFYTAAGFLNFGLAQSVIPLNTWTHLMVKRECTFIYLYINGVQVGNALNVTTNVLSPGNSPVQVGADGVGLGFTAYIDEVRIVNYARFAVPTSEYTG